MKTSEMLPRRFASKEDLFDSAAGDYQEWLLTIARCSLEDMPGDAGEQRWVLHFKEFDKGLALNGTNIKFLERELGDESDGWNGRKVILFFDASVMFKGQQTGGLRLKSARPPKPIVQPKAPKPLVPPTDPDSEIP